MEFNSLDIVVNGIEMSVGGEFIPEDGGKLYGIPEDCYPPEPAETYILDVKMTTDNLLYLLDKAYFKVGNAYIYVSDLIEEAVINKLGE